MLAKKIALGFGIAVVFPVMVHYGVSTFVPQPKWQDFYGCDVYQDYNSMTPEQKAVYNQNRQQKERARRSQEKRFQSALFVVAVPIGLVGLVTGAFMSVQPIGTGLMFGGIFSTLDGFCNYWGELPDGARFFSMLVTFAALLYIGIRKLSK